MPTKRVFRNMMPAARRAGFSTLLCGIAAVTVSAEIVDLATTTIERDGTPIRQVQAQSPTPLQPPAPQTPSPQTPTPLQPPATVPQPPAPADQPPQAAVPTPPDLNVDPNAGIGEIPMPQNLAPPSAPQSFTGGLGATAGGFASAPNMIGDFQGGGLGQIGGVFTQQFSFHAPGFYVSGSPGAQIATIAYEVGSDIVPNDVFTTGPGIDAAGSDGQFDTFSILEPVPPSDAPTSPGQGFTFDGGNAVFTRTTGPTTPQPGSIDDGDQWFIRYSYSALLGPGVGALPVPSPGVSVRRVKIAENFSPEVRDRVFLNFSFFNDSFGGLGDVSRWVPGFEKILYEDLISLETRIPLAGTFGSRQTLGLRQNRSAELGNITLITKGVLLRTERLIWSGGMGVGIPTADDTVVRSRGRDVIRIKNESVFLQPFMGVLYRQGRDTYFQSYVQLDVTANGDPVYANLAGDGGLPQVGVFNDSNLIHVDASISHSIYRNRCARVLKQLLANAEIHYTGTIQESDFVEGDNFTFTNLKRNFTIVNATFGMHMLMGRGFVVTPAMSVPLRSGLDEQFDYEALVQLNYIH